MELNAGHHRRDVLLLMAVAVVTWPCTAHGQRRGSGMPAGPSPPASPMAAQREAMEQLARSWTEAAKLAAEYKASLERLLAFYEADESHAAAEVRKRRELFASGIVSRVELDQAVRAHADAQDNLEETRRRIVDANHAASEAFANAQEARQGPLPPGGYQVTDGLIRFNGAAGWTLADAANVRAFFSTRFGRVLPVSAFGQTAVHDRLGFDHRNAMDIAVHPDSAEGKSLIAYLRGSGIPFLAFRGAVAGISTGAHVHVGRPSPRL